MSNGEPLSCGVDVIFFAAVIFVPKLGKYV